MLFRPIEHAEADAGARWTSEDQPMTICWFGHAHEPDQKQACMVESDT
jgi:hypothetical protein